MTQEEEKLLQLHRINQSFSSEPIYEKHKAIRSLFQVAKAFDVFKGIKNQDKASKRNLGSIKLNAAIGFQLFERHWWKTEEDTRYYYKWQFYIVEGFDQEKAGVIVDFMQDRAALWKNLFTYFQNNVGDMPLLKSIKWLQANCLSTESAKRYPAVLHHHLLNVYSSLPLTGIMLVDIWEQYYDFEDRERLEFLKGNGSPPAFLVKLYSEKQKDKKDFPPFKYRVILNPGSSPADSKFKDVNPQSPTSYYRINDNDQNLESVQRLFEEYLYALFYNPKFLGDDFTNTPDIIGDLGIRGFLFFPIYELLVQNKLYGAHLGWLQVPITGEAEKEKTILDDIDDQSSEESQDVIHELSNACEMFQALLHKYLTGKLLQGIKTDILQEEFRAGESSKEFLARHIYRLGGWYCDETNTRVSDSKDNDNPDKPCILDDDGNIVINLAWQWPLDEDAGSAVDFLYLKKKPDTLVPNTELVEDQTEIARIRFDRDGAFKDGIEHIENRLAAQKVNIGHRLPGKLEAIINAFNRAKRLLLKNIDSLTYLLQELKSTSGDSVPKDIEKISLALNSTIESFDSTLSPKIYMLYLSSSLQQNNLPPWNSYQEKCKLSNGKFALKDTVIKNIWEQVAVPVGESNIRQKGHGVDVDKCLDGAIENGIDFTPNERENLVLSNEYDFRTILSLLVVHLIEAYEHTLLSSMKSIANKTSANFNAEVSIEVSKNSLVIMNPVYIKSDEDTNRILRDFADGNQKKEIDKIVSLAPGRLQLKPTFPGLSGINQGDWQVKYEWWASNAK